MKTLYKKGYLIRVTSWENDGDNYRTEEVHEYNEETAKQIVEFAKLFKSKIGNLNDNERDKATETFLAFIEKYPEFIPNDAIEDWENADEIVDYLVDVPMYNLGLTGGDYFFTRVAEKIEIFYFPEDVKCEEIKW